MIFLSYSRENSPAASALEKEITANEYKIFRDPPLVEGNPFWRNRITEGWGDCDLMIVLWSVYALQSPWVDQEIRAFNGLKGFVLLDNCLVPSHYSGINIKQEELLKFLKKKGVPQKNSCSGTSLNLNDIANQRKQRVQQSLKKLEELDKCKRDSCVPLRTGNTDWLFADGTSYKPVHRRAGNYKKGDAIVLLSVLPVTNRQYLNFANLSGWQAPFNTINNPALDDNCPVVGLSWFDAKAYAMWFNADLPCVANWESAANAGKETPYATNDGTISSSNCHFMKPFGEEKPVDPTLFEPNPAGFYGMCGNTWDWCKDFQGPYCAIKGGGYMDSAAFCRVTSGYRNAPIDKDCCVGFRLQYETIL